MAYGWCKVLWCHFHLVWLVFWGFQPYMHLVSFRYGIVWAIIHMDTHGFNTKLSCWRKKYASKIMHIIICLTHTNVWETMGKEALQLHAVYKKLYFLLQVTQESISVLQVTWEFVSVLVSGTASHTHYVWACNEIKGSYDKIIITIVPSYTGKISWVCCRLYCYKCTALFPLLVLSATQCLVKWEWLCDRVVVIEFWHGFIDYDYLSWIIN